MAEIVLASRDDWSHGVGGVRPTGPQNQDIANFRRPLPCHWPFLLVQQVNDFLKRPDMISFVSESSAVHVQQSPHPSAFLSAVVFFSFEPTTDQIHRTAHASLRLRDFSSWYFEQAGRCRCQKLEMRRRWAVGDRELCSRPLRHLEALVRARILVSKQRSPVVVVPERQAWSKEWRVSPGTMRQRGRSGGAARWPLESRRCARRPAASRTVGWASVRDVIRQHIAARRHLDGCTSFKPQADSSSSSSIRCSGFLPFATVFRFRGSDVTRNVTR